MCYWRNLSSLAYHSKASLLTLLGGSEGKYSIYCRHQTGTGSLGSKASELLMAVREGYLKATFGVTVCSWNQGRPRRLKLFSTRETLFSTREAV